ncbi:hypothetical protein MKK84_03445 [Methylobacterium sp. E-065]|uniref:hypothetical protein n=1 Tax=Methylobacterium sp. E-065 TaxID=2836583 RepID=UPI001FBA0C21|nr:hypothetical protein [Methylobacterium sp. E-065]MCJ2016486.1 hypothetical protein [Methylobacterium sp. E-065]
MSQQTHFIAVPAHDQAVKLVYGFGTTAEGAIDDAFNEGGSNVHRPAVHDHGTDSDEAAVGHRYSYTRTTGEVAEGGYADEASAQAAADAAGFTAIPCTPALYEAVRSAGTVDWIYNSAGEADLRVAA